MKYLLIILSALIFGCTTYTVRDKIMSYPVPEVSDSLNLSNTPYGWFGYKVDADSAVIAVRVDTVKKIVYVNTKGNVIKVPVRDSSLDNENKALRDEAERLRKQNEALANQKQHADTKWIWIMVTVMVLSGLTAYLIFKFKR